jgi:hypothetical protein
MTIEQSKSEHYTKKITSFSGSVYNEEIYPWRVVCDFCSKPAFASGEDPGSSADAARKDNFITVPSKSVALPSKWKCLECQKKDST